MYNWPNISIHTMRDQFISIDTCVQSHLLFIAALRRALAIEQPLPLRPPARIHDRRPRQPSSRAVEH